MCAVLWPSTSRFLSTPSARRATLGTVDDADFLKVFLSTPSARRATQQQERNGRHEGISIHALREEGDRCSRAAQQAQRKFLSTPSARRATPCSWRSTAQRRNFYPRPPRGGRPAPAQNTGRCRNFYPRPPRGGRQQKQRQNLYFLINYTTFCTNLEEP